MKSLKSLTVGVFALALMALPLKAAAETCCEKAHAAGKDCSHQCCIDAHKEGKSCTKCNPNKEDEKFIKSPKDAEKKPEAPK